MSSKVSNKFLTYIVAQSSAQVCQLHSMYSNYEASYVFAIEKQTSETVNTTFSFQREKL